MTTLDDKTEVWVILRFEEFDGDVQIVDVCDSHDTAKLALEHDRKWILEDDYTPPVDPDDADDETPDDRDHGYEWTIERRYITTAAHLK